MKKDWIKIIEPLVLVSWCPQCKKIIKMYSEPDKLQVQELFEDDIRHRTDGIDKAKHTPFLMVRIVV